MKLKEDGFEVKVPLIYRLLQPAHTVSRISNAFLGRNGEGWIRPLAKAKGPPCFLGARK